MLAGLGVGYAAKVQGPLGGLPGGPDPSKVDRLDILLWGSWGVTGVDVVPPAALFSPWVSAEDMQCRPVRRYRFPLVISHCSSTSARTFFFGRGANVSAYVQHDREVLPL